MEFIYNGEPIRLDIAISKQFPDISRSQAKDIIDSGTVFVDEKPQKASFLVSKGSKIEFDYISKEPINAKPEDIPIDIVYEDDDILVVNKARGMVVHPAVGQACGTLVNAVLFHLGREANTEDVRPGIVHRIDKDTTGLLVIAKNDKAHLSLAEQIQNRQMHRTYYALVHGEVKENGTVDIPIGRSQIDRKKMAVTEKNSKRAVTHYEVLEQFEGYTLLKCNLETGRTHQIRVHMAYINHPIVGDKTYSTRKEKWKLEGQLLHAKELEFIHPTKKEPVKFTAPLPDDFNKVLSLLH